MNELNTFLSVSFVIGFFMTSFAQLSENNMAPAAYYPLNGDARDASGNNYHATLHGPVPVVGANGQEDNAFEFDGVDDYITRDQIFDVNSQTAISISAWFYVDAIDVENQFTGISFGKKTSGTVSLRIRRNDSRVFQAIIGDPLESDYTDVRSNSIQFGQWYHVVGIFQDKNVQLWVNGVDQGSFNHGVDGVNLSELMNADNLYIGNAYVDDDAQRYFDGKIDEVKIYNTVLTPTTINALFEEGNAPHIEKTLVEIEGGALFINSDQTLILKGDDGHCYQIKVDASGQLKHVLVMCPH